MGACQAQVSHCVFFLIVSPVKIDDRPISATAQSGKPVKGNLPGAAGLCVFFVVGFNGGGVAGPPFGPVSVVVVVEGVVVAVLVVELVVVVVVWVVDEVVVVDDDDVLGVVDVVPPPPDPPPPVVVVVPGDVVTVLTQVPLVLTMTCPDTEPRVTVTSVIPSLSPGMNCGSAGAGCPSTLPITT